MRGLLVMGILNHFGQSLSLKAKVIREKFVMVLNRNFVPYGHHGRSFFWRNDDDDDVDVDDDDDDVVVVVDDNNDHPDPAADIWWYHT